MKKRYFAFLTALLIVCCATQVAFAKPQFTNFKQWFGKAYGEDATFFEFTVIDRNWEVSNKMIFISLYNNKRKLIHKNPYMSEKYILNSFGVRAPDCTTAQKLSDTGPKYDNESFVKYSNGRYRVRDCVSGKHQIASYQVQWY